MIRRLIATLFAVLALLTPMHVAAHEGHEHKILGTVTMAAPDHVMLKDKAGKDVTVHVTAQTKVRQDGKPAKVEDIQNGVRVAITAVTVKENKVEKMVARTIDLPAAQGTK